MKLRFLIAALLLALVGCSPDRTEPAYAFDAEGFIDCPAAAAVGQDATFAFCVWPCTDWHGERQYVELLVNFTNGDRIATWSVGACTK